MNIEPQKNHIGRWYEEETSKSTMESRDAWSEKQKYTGRNFPCKIILYQSNMPKQYETRVQSEVGSLATHLLDPKHIAEQD